MGHAFYIGLEFTLHPRRALVNAGRRWSSQFGGFLQQYCL